jgi:hypothetical protein
LQTREFLEGTLIVSLGSVDAVLEAGEDFAVVAIDGAAERIGPDLVVIGPLGVVHLFIPQLGFGAAEAAEGPFGMDEDVDEAALFGRFGLETVDVFEGEDCEVAGIFAADDFGFGINTGL